MNTQIIWIIDHIANNVEPHTHDFYQMIFCQKKGGEITIDNKTHEAKQDHIYSAQNLFTNQKKKSRFIFGFSTTFNIIILFCFFAVCAIFTQR